MKPMKFYRRNNAIAAVAILPAIIQLSSAFTSILHHCSECRSLDRGRASILGVRQLVEALKASSEEDERDYISPMRQRPKPKGGDVAYTNENILRQQLHFKNIRNAGGVDCVSDLYARDPSTSGSATRFWFVGKVARCTGKCPRHQHLYLLMQLFLSDSYHTNNRDCK
jgi:hypothetical protein